MDRKKIIVCFSLPENMECKRKFEETNVVESTDMNVTKKKKMNVVLPSVDEQPSTSRPNNSVEFEKTGSSKSTRYENLETSRSPCSSRDEIYDDGQKPCSSRVSRINNNNNGITIRGNNMLIRRNNNSDEFVDELDRTLTNNMNRYSADVAVNDEESEPEDYALLRRNKSINYKLYMKYGYCFIDVPVDKFKSYRMMTKAFGYEYNRTNDFLRNGGILNVLQFERPFFCFWEHGLELYFPRTETPKDKPIKLVIKRTHCVEHEFQCPMSVNTSNPCRFQVNFESGSAATFLVAGYLRSRKINVRGTSMFISNSIELDNSRRIETTKFHVSDQLTIKNIRLNVYLMHTCFHNDCGVGEIDEPFEGMPRTYSMCSRIERVSEIKEEYNKLRCYAYGRGIQGTYHEATNTIFLSSWHVTDIFIIYPSKI
ncbi:hypothetical protein [Drosophila suzukii associated hytrosavirus 1]|nr:hypothetical protein [Drosophila suzukii associated hytrosavirus 1]